MQSSLPNCRLSVVWIILLVFVGCFRGAGAEAADAIDSILLSNEFKAEEKQVLASLPVTSVDDLTSRLNAAPIDDIKTHRLFEFLVFKVRQFGADLPEDKKSAALKALKAKFGSDEEHRRTLIRSLEGVSENGRSNQNANRLLSPPPVELTAPKRPPEVGPTATTPSEGPASSTPWSIIVVLFVAAIGLLWLLLKRRS